MWAGQRRALTRHAVLDSAYLDSALSGSANSVTRRLFVVNYLYNKIIIKKICDPFIFLRFVFRLTEDHFCKLRNIIPKAAQETDLEWFQGIISKYLVTYCTNEFAWKNLSFMISLHVLHHILIKVCVFQRSAQLSVVSLWQTTGREVYIHHEDLMLNKYISKVGAFL